MSLKPSRILQQCISCNSCPVYTSPQDFENGGFTLKRGLWKLRIKCSLIVFFSSFFFRMRELRESREAVNKRKTSGTRVFRVGKSNYYSDCYCFRCRLCKLKRKALVFRFLRFEKRFRETPFLWRISVDGRPNRKNNPAFSYSSGVSVLTARQLLIDLAIQP